MKTLPQGFNTVAQDSNPGSLSRESEALPLSHYEAGSFSQQKGNGEQRHQDTWHASSTMAKCYGHQRKAYGRRLAAVIESLFQDVVQVRLCVKLSVIDLQALPPFGPEPQNLHPVGGNNI